MVRAHRQRVKIGAGGIVEIRSSELPPGADADVIVLVETADAATLPSDATAKLALLKDIQRRLNLTAATADAWIEQVRDERETGSVNTG